MSKVNFTTGNFDLVIEGTLKAEQRDKAIDAGIRWILQRDGASKAYIILAGEENEKGKSRLPKGFERDSVEYSDENAEAVKTAFEEAMADYGDFSVEVSEHVAGAAATPGVMATSLWEQAKENDALRTNLFATTKVKDDGTDEAGMNAARAFLAGLRGKKA